MKKFLTGLGASAILVTAVLSILPGTSYACGFFSSCSVDTNATQTFTKEAAITEQNQRKLSQNQPLPTFETSLERTNLINRLKQWNDKDKVSYVYLLQFGKVMSFYTVKGKVSSMNSLVTNPVQSIDWNGDQCSQHIDHTCYQVPSPDLDGSYGDNPSGIFFWTTDGAYVEWSGDYMLSDQPLKLTTPAELVRDVQ